MGQIYEGAANTIMYLGPAVPGSDECWYLESVRQGHSTTPDSQLLFSIFGKEWFTRVWVFQGLVFAANPWVQCGRARAKWMTMYKELLCMDMKSLDDLQGDKYGIVKQMYEAWESHQGDRKLGPPKSEDAIFVRAVESSPNSMLNLVLARRGLGVSDPRGKSQFSLAAPMTSFSLSP